MHTKKKNCQFKKIIAKQRVLWNLVQTFKFCVELVYVHVFSLFSIERIFVENLFQYSDPHIAKFVSREIEVFSSSLWQILIPHITLVFCKPLFHLLIRLTNILDVTFLACDLCPKEDFFDISAWKVHTKEYIYNIFIFFSITGKNFTIIWYF